MPEGRAIERLEDELQRAEGRAGWGARLAAVLREYAEGCQACNGHSTASCSSCATRKERALHALAGWDRAHSGTGAKSKPD